MNDKDHTYTVSFTNATQNKTFILKHDDFLYNISHLLKIYEIIREGAEMYTIKLHLYSVELPGNEPYLYIQASSDLGVAYWCVPCVREL
jgi:hypothetical protein